MRSFEQGRKSEPHAKENSSLFVKSLLSFLHEGAAGWDSRVGTLAASRGSPGHVLRPAVILLFLSGLRTSHGSFRQMRHYLTFFYFWLGNATQARVCFMALDTAWATSPSPAETPHEDTGCSMPVMTTIHMVTAMQPGVEGMRRPRDQTDLASNPTSAT